MELRQEAPQGISSISPEVDEWNEPTIYQIHKIIDENANIIEIEDGGQKITVIGEDFGNCLFLIERFMREIRAGKKAFSSEKSRHECMKPLALASYLTLMNAFLAVHSPRKTYSPEVSLFFDVCITKYGLVAHDFVGGPNAYNPSFKMKVGEFFNKLIEEMSTRMSGRSFKKKLYARREAIKRGRENAEEYIDALFARWSRLLVLRIDFGFRTSNPILVHPVNLEAAQECLGRFLNNKRGKKLYEALRGYIWRLEYGKLKGYHFHVIFFFDGAKVRKDEYLAGEIGTDWIKVTDGKGIYFNCNAKKLKYKRVGIGMISHDDHEKRRNLLDVVEYMHKEDQTVREKHSPKTHCWGRGRPPSARSSTSGRPRRNGLKLT